MIFEEKRCCKISTLAKCNCQNFIHTKWPQHVTVFPWELQWLPVKDQIDFKIAWMASEAQQWGTVCLSESLLVHEPGSLPAGVDKLTHVPSVGEVKSLTFNNLTCTYGDHSTAVSYTLGMVGICAAKVGTFGIFTSLCKAHQNLKIVLQCMYVHCDIETCHIHN